MALTFPRPARTERLGRVLIPDYPRILWAGRRWLAFAAFLFAMGIAAGYLFGAARPALAMSVDQPSMEKLRQLSERVMGTASPVERALLIYVNNLLAVYVMFEGGLLAGIVPALALFFNGAQVGVLMALSGRLAAAPISPLMLLAAVAPHGAFEVPALWFGGAWGMRLGLKWLHSAAAGQRRRVLARSALEAGQVFVLSAALLLVASFVEGNVTVALVRALHA
jgi:stage II sporulation protein M